MTDKKIADKVEAIAKKLQYDIAKVISDGLGVPVVVVDKDIISQIVEIAKQDLELMKHFSEEDIADEVSRAYADLTIPTPKNVSDFKKRAKLFLSELRQEKEYVAVMVLQGLVGLPIGTKLGSLEIIPPNLSKKDLVEHLNYLKINKKINVEGCNWAKLEFKSYRISGSSIRELFFKGLELPFSIISLIMPAEIDVKDVAGIIYSSVKRKYYFEPSKTYLGRSYYQKRFDKYLAVSTKITQKNKPTPIEKKILDALKIFRLSKAAYQIEIKFLIVTAAIECLLLTEKDKDYLSLKLAEKAAFLLKKEGKECYELYKLMKRLYNKRSDFIHKGISRISKQNFSNLENIFTQLIFELLALSSKYEKMGEKSSRQGKEGVGDYINRIKYSLSEDYDVFFTEE